MLFEHRHSRHNSLDLVQLHPFAPTRTTAPTPSTRPSCHRDASEATTMTSGIFSRQSRRLSRTGAAESAPPAVLPRRHSTGTANREELDPTVFEPVSASSSTTSLRSRATDDWGDDESLGEREREGAESSEEYNSIPISRRQASSEAALFAPTTSLSERRIKRFDKQFHREETLNRRDKLKELKAGVEIAMGVSHLYKEEKKLEKQKRRGGSTTAGDRGSSSRERGKSPSGSPFGFRQVEELFEGVEKQVEGARHGTTDSTEPPRREHDRGTKPNSIDRLLEAGTGALGVAGVAELAGVGWEWYRKHERENKHLLATGNGLARPASAPAISPTTITRGESERDPFPRTPLLPPSSMAPPIVFPASRILSPSAGAVGMPPMYISHLSPTQHKTLQHAAAALLLKHHERHVQPQALQWNGRIDVGKTYHYDEIGLIIGAVAGGWKEMTGLVREGLTKVEHARKSIRLFGVDLKELTKHEGVDSSHGIDPSAKGLRIPEFLDHLITALKQSDMSVPGILRRTGNVRQILEIIDALDHSNGSNQTVLDLAKLDPVTLANLFTKLLGALPHPVLTHHLFGLFVATSHIRHPGLRRRAMHLVICLMPKVNRDVMECVFLFLSWLSKHAHLSVIDGQRLDLTGIATIMAPILLSPKNRNPHPDELKSMIAAVLNLLEDQHILHEIPLELAHLLHIEPPAPHSSQAGGSHDVAGFIKHLFDRL